MHRSLFQSNFEQALQVIGRGGIADRKPIRSRFDGVAVKGGQRILEPKPALSARERDVGQQRIPIRRCGQAQGKALRRARVAALQSAPRQRRLDEWRRRDFVERAIDRIAKRSRNPTRKRPGNRGGRR
jgi:hypothetical protein